MKDLLGFIFVGITAVGFLGWTLLLLVHLAYQRGVEAGRLAERQWLLGVQDGVEAEREKVWREEIG